MTILGGIIMSDNRVLNQIKNKAILIEVGHEYIHEMVEDVELDKKIQCPKEMDDWFNSFSVQLVKEERKERWLSFFKTVGKRAAVFFGGSLIALSILTMSVEAFRMEIFNMLLGSHDVYNEMFFEQSTLYDDIPEINDGVYLTHLPEGYALHEAIENSEFNTFVYKDYNDNLVVLTQKDINDSTRIKFDSEVDGQKAVDIKDDIGYIYMKDEYTSITWMDKKNIYKIEGSISIEDMIKAAKSIKFIE